MVRGVGGGGGAWYLHFKARRLCELILTPMKLYEPNKLNLWPLFAALEVDVTQNPSLVGSRFWRGSETPVTFHPKAGRGVGGF